MEEFLSVAPFVGVWIEISVGKAILSFLTLSLPSWECGLKFSNCAQVFRSHQSLPSWECGLKSVIPAAFYEPFDVAPFVGVWIEITRE